MFFRNPCKYIYKYMWVASLALFIGKHKKQKKTFLSATWEELFGSCNFHAESSMKMVIKLF